jgi:D-aminopeptidase
MVPSGVVPAASLLGATVNIESPRIASLFDGLDHRDAPGGVVGVALNGRTIHRRGYGLANLEHGVAMTPQTRMRIASVTKQFTCLAVLLLADEGRLDIDEPVRRYLPDLPAMVLAPTVRQLMMHTSGWRCHVDLAELADGAGHQPKGSAWAALMRQGELNFPPGQRVLYSNGGYQLLSQLVERVGDMPFDVFMRRRIFEPLGMPDTEFVPSDFEVCRGLAGLYQVQPDGSHRRGIFPNEEIRGDGGMVSTADDMLTWMSHLRTPGFLGTDACRQQLLSRGSLGSAAPSPYGMGLIHARYRGLDLVRHPGGGRGCASEMVTVPSHGLDVIIMTNGARASPTELALKVVEALIGDDALGPPIEWAAAADFKPVLGASYHAPETGLLVEFADVGGRLGLSLFNSPPLPLRREGSELRINVEDAGAGPVVMRQGALPSSGAAPGFLEIAEGDQLHRLTRLTAADGEACDLEALVGRYESPDLGASARIEMQDDALTLSIRGRHGINAVRLRPVAADVLGWTRTGGSITHGALNVDRVQGRIAGLRLQTFRSRNVRLRPM